jgi:hypothetical protein
VLDVWREYATDVRGRALPSGHYLAEERPGEVAEELVAFLQNGSPSHSSPPSSSGTAR